MRVKVIAEAKGIERRLVRAFCWSVCMHISALFLSCIFHYNRGSQTEVRGPQWVCEGYGGGSAGAFCHGNIHYHCMVSALISTNNQCFKFNSDMVCNDDHNQKATTVWHCQHTDR